MPERTIDYKARLKKKAAPVARELRGIKGIKNVDLNEDRIFVNGRGVWASLQWGDWQGDALTGHLANEYARFRKLEEYAADRGNDLQIDVYGELKELCCKLAGMTEDEMQRYILKKESGKDEDLYREADWDNKKTPFTDQPNRANEKPVSGSVPASIHRDSSSIAMASKQADAKIDNDTQSARTKIKKYRNGDFFVDVNTLDKALSDVGKILSMRTKGGSRYSILRTKGGNTVAIRLSDHLANGNNFKRNNANSNLSIVIERHIYNTKGESDIEYTEAVIKEATFNSSPEKVINAIVNGVNDVLEDKEFTLDSSIGEVSVEGPSKIEDKNLYREADLEAVNERFNEELELQIDGSLPEGHIYQLGMPSDILLSTGVPKLPIQMSASRLKAKATSYGHNFDLGEIRDIVKAIQSPMAVFAYGNKEKAQNLIVEIQSNGKNFVVGLSLKPTVGGRVLEINSVRNVFPKDTAEWMNWIPQGKALYVDKERIQNLIDQQRTILADVDYLDLDSVTKIVKEFENPSMEDENLRTGDGSYSDEQLSYENDPIAKWLGESKRLKSQQQEYAQRVRERMVNRAKELAERLHLDNVEVVTDASTLEGKKARAKGWFSPKTGKIVVVIPNHKSIADVEQTVLHEAVAHYGLRKLFGKHFDDFLWNVYNNASEDVRRKIADLAAKRGWDFPKATEEYLASLAEDTDFENAVNSGWFSKIKFFFMKMLAKAGVKLGVELGDNELRYILWRSYENMAEPGRYRGVIEEAADIAKQYELGVGNYANGSSGQQHVAEDLFRDGDPEGTLSGTDGEGASDGRAMTEDDVEMYLNALHGPERNQLMAERDAEAKAIDANGGYMKEPVCG